MYILILIVTLTKLTTELGIVLSNVTSTPNTAIRTTTTSNAYHIYIYECALKLHSVLI